MIGLGVAATLTSIAVGARNHFLKQVDTPGARPAGIGGSAYGADPAARRELEDAGAPAGVIALPAGGARTASGAAGLGTGASAAAAKTVVGSGDGARVPRAPDAAVMERSPTPAAEELAQNQEAATVLQRAAAAYDRVRSLRAEFVQHMENPLLGTRTTSRGTLYQRGADRFLLRFTDPEGDVIVSDGKYFWIYYPSVDQRQVIRAPAGPNGAGGVDLRAQFLGDPLTRFLPALEGTEVVAGREAYVLVLTPRMEAGYRMLKVWVDAKDSLVRRFEIAEENGSVRRFDLSNLAVNPALGDELFRFTPPPGARVIDRS
ncbi:MAG: outer-membrane lipoprotein carrier protein LolA [Gemmatimonadetes bacterium]|nr:outer-membrane lipoprotein carrier protein LolA [Gemmatimonadota bacterium]